MIADLVAAATPAAEAAPPVARAPVFEPMLDAPYRCETLETRSDGVTIRRFRTVRRIVFRRETGGFAAEATLLSAEQTGPGIGPLFAAGNSALLNRPVFIHLDSGGTVIGVDDGDALIDLIAARIEAAASLIAPDRAKLFAAPLRAMAAPQRLAMLGSSLSQLARGSDLLLAPGTRPVTLPARPPLPTGGAITGTQTVAAASGRVMTITQTARAPIATPGALAFGTSGATGEIALRIERQIDRRTGLLIASHSVSETTTAASGGRHGMTESTSVTLTPERK